MPTALGLPATKAAAANPLTGYSAKYTGATAFAPSTNGMGPQGGNQFFTVTGPNGNVVDQAAFAQALGLTAPQAAGRGANSGQFAAYNDAITAGYKSIASPEDVKALADYNSQATKYDAEKHSGRLGNFALSTAALFAAPYLSALAAAPAAAGTAGATAAATGAGGFSLGSTALGAGIGGGLGYLQGGVKGALTGALSGGLGGYSAGGGASQLGSAFNDFAGLGLSAERAAALGGTALGAVGGGISGGKTGALTGGVVSGLGSYAKAGGFEGLLDSASSGDEINSALGSFSGPISTTNKYDVTPYASIASGITPASTSEGRTLFSTPSAATDATDGDGMNKYISPLLSAGIGAYTQQGAADDIIASQERNRELLSPFLNASFSPGDLENEPGYQFQLQQGENALKRAQAARGNFFSGGALTAAADYNQGLAGTAYKDAFNRWLATNGQQLGAAGAIADSNTNIGNAKANALVGTGNVLTQGVAGLFPSANETAYTALLKRLAVGA